MPKFTYGEGKYLFEYDFASMVLPESAYKNFVRNCRKLIKEDRKNKKAEHKVLKGYVVDPSVVK